MLELVPLRGSLEVITDPLAEHLLVLPAPGEPLALAIQALVLSWSHSPAGRRAIDQTARCIPLGYKYRSRGVVMPTRCECDQLYASRQST